NKGVFTPSHPVPSVTGMTLAQARQAVAKDKFTVVTTPAVTSVSVKPGQVVRQDPAAGSSLKQGSALNVTLSSGLPAETIPSLKGLGCNGAKRLLAVSHLKGSCPASTAGYSASVPVGQIINWSYGNKLDAKHAPYGATVLIALSKGPQPKTIPNVVGDTYQAAVAALQQDGLQATESSAPSTSTPSGYVASTTPAIGSQVPPNSTVTVNVSSGPPTVQVPNMSGESVSQATAALEAKGLVLGDVYGPKSGTVFTSVPDAGQTVTEGSAVNVYTD
ncbi:MAG: PASTA domain-containing protein, partial [Acidimicrobiales bacterium]